MNLDAVRFVPDPNCPVVAPDVPAPPPPPRVVTGPARALAVVHASGRPDSAWGRFDLQQVVFGCAAGKPFAAASDAKVLARVGWYDSYGPRAVEPFGVPADAVRLALRHLKEFGTQIDDISFRVESLDDGVKLSLLSPDVRPEDGVAAFTVRAAGKSDKFPVKMLDTFAEVVTGAIAPDLGARHRPLCSKVISKVAKILDLVTFDRDFDAGMVATRAGVTSAYWVFRFGEAPDTLPFGVNGFLITLPLER